MDTRAINRERFTAITAVFLALSLLHILYGLQAGGATLAITKGLPVVFLFACACIWGRDHIRVIFALLFSFIGDYVAEAPLPGHSAFHLQITFFALAQVCYILEFLRYCPSARKQTSGKTLSLTPVLCGIYGLFVLGTVVTSCLQRRSQKGVFVAGAIIFAVSDSLILARMLTGGFPGDEVAVMGTYYLAQYLLNIVIISSMEKENEPCR